MLKKFQEVDNRMAQKPLPPYMEAGSKGPHVTIAQGLVCIAGLGKGIVCDESYGPVTTGAVSQFQARNGIDTDGGFGPQTRAKAQEALGLGYTFEDLCRGIPGTTIFVQPDGTEISWSRDDEEED